MAEKGKGKVSTKKKSGKGRKKRPKLDLLFQHDLLEAGCDEAGRGCLAGPVSAAAVILPEGFKCDLVQDSKQLSASDREAAREIIEREAVCWAVSLVGPRMIDRINILNASYLAMHRALAKLSQEPEFVVLDGNRFKPWKKKPYACVVKGDGKIMSIAAASILAKTHRDAYMDRAHEKHPHYAWDSNRGYPTADHREALKLHGHTDLHRMSFQLLPRPVQGSLFES
jgi:ribonuclease HII